MESDWKKIEPNIWKPEKDGDEITGILISKDPSDKFKNINYHIETLEHEQKMIYGTTVLNDRMKFVNVGETIKIVFKGIVKNQKKQDTKVFEVFKK